MAARPRLGELLKLHFKLEYKEKKQIQRIGLQIMAQDSVLLWLESEKKFLLFSKTAIPALQHGEEVDMEKLPCKELTCSQSINFEVFFMEMNISGKFVALVGLNDIAVVELPSFCFTTSSLAAHQSDIICRTILVGDCLSRQKLDLQILNVQWFPGSPTDSHIIVLTNDNCLRCFDVGNVIKPLSTINLCDYHTPKRMHATVNFALAYGEVAVSFCIAPPVSGKNEEVRHPIFVLQENGNVLIIWSWLNLQRMFWIRQGPLRIISESEETYHWNFCSILCLKTAPSVIVLATKCGIQHHCIVLDGEDKIPENELQDEVADNAVAKSVVLYIYESIGLETAFSKSTGGNGNREAMESTVSLVEDPSDASCYFALSPAGVHMVHLQWLHELKEFASSDLDVRAPSDVCFLLSTQPTVKGDSRKIVGFSVVNDHGNNSVVVCLLDNGEIVTRTTSRTSYGIEDRNEASENRSQDDFEEYQLLLKELRDVDAEKQQQYFRMSKERFEELLLRIEDRPVHSGTFRFLISPRKRHHHEIPTKSQLFSGSFDKSIKNILQRSRSSSIIKALDQEPSQKEFYQLLAGATNCMREEYIRRQTEARIEITKRCEILKKLKIQQMCAIAELADGRTLFDNAEIVAEKLYTVSDNLLSITDRLHNIMQFVQKNSPVISDAEQSWKAEVEGMQNKLMHFKRNMEELKQRTENISLSQVRMRKTGSNDNKLTPSQLLKVKAKLKEQNNKIGELFETTKTLQSKIQSS